MNKRKIGRVLLGLALNISGSFINAQKHAYKLAILACLFISFYTSSSSAQSGFVVGPPAWTSTSIQTTGGITYFTHSATLPDCNWITNSIGPRSGTNLTLTTAEMRGLHCPQCQDCSHTETQVTVLGHLPPGQYRLSCYAPDPLDSTPSVFRLIDFQVPSETGPTLAAAAPEGGAVKIHLRGVPLATYSIQASTDFTNWVTITNISGGPAEIISPANTTPYRFYRAIIRGGVLNSK